MKNLGGLGCQNIFCTTINCTGFTCVNSLNGTSINSQQNTNVGSSNESSYRVIADNSSNYIEMVESGTANTNRGLIRSAGSAGIDIDCLGASKSIRLMTNNTARATISDTAYNLPLLTASQAVITDGSSNLISLPFTTTATANALVERDSSGNIFANNIINSINSDSTAAQLIVGAGTCTVSTTSGTTTVTGTGVAAAITSINGNTNAAQTIAAGANVTVTSVGGTTTIASTVNFFYENLL